MDEIEKAKKLDKESESDYETLKNAGINASYQPHMWMLGKRLLAKWREQPSDALKNQLEALGIASPDHSDGDWGTGERGSDYNQEQNG